MGYRSRASFKLKEIQEKDRIFRPGLTVVDLGAAPGGWSQLAAEWVSPGGRVIASDMLPMDPLNGVNFILGDFTEDAVLHALLNAIGDEGVDLVISDMAPNLSGMKAIDQPRAMELVELAYDLAGRILKPNGTLLVKVFQGAGLDDFQKSLRSGFKAVKTRKPKASRSRSAEYYLLANGFNPEG